MNIQTVRHPTQDLDVEAVTIHSADDLVELRASDWHEGQLAILTYATAAPVGFLSPDNPRFLGGQIVNVGDTILKGPAGDFEVVTAEEWWG